MINKDLDLFEHLAIGLQACAERLLERTIPSDQMRVTITQEVVNCLSELNTDWAKSASPDFFFTEEGEDVFELIDTKIKSLLNTELVLGET